MNLRKQSSTQLRARLPACQQVVNGDEPLENPATKRRQLIEASSQARLNGFQDHGNDARVSDLEASKRFLQILRPQGAQVHHSGTANERANEAHHEINGMVCRQNTQVAHTWPKRVPGHQRLALLQ